MTDLQKRIIGAFYFVPVICGAIYGNPFLFIVISIVQALMCYELAQILGKAKGQSALRSLSVTGLFLLASLAPHAPLYDANALALSGGLIAISFIFVLITNSLFTAVFTAVLLICLASLSFLITLPETELFLIALAVVITITDVAAYVVGRRIGGRKLAPSISPGKTISGAIGGLIGAVIASYFVSYLAGYISGTSQLDFIHSNMIITGVLIGLLSQMGDLYESAFKRRMNIKDSSQMIPGHGGVLDRFDGYLFVLPLTIMLLMLAGF